MKTITLKYNNAGISNRNRFSPALIQSILATLLFLGCTGSLSAQNVGINSTAALPKSSAILDLSTGNNGTLGFLPPKVALQATNVKAPITNPSNGLLVYDTVTAGAAPNNVFEGLYYWNGAAWVRLLDIPYGVNVKSAVGATDIKTNSAAFAPIADMSITFTPVHSVVFVSFTAAGISDLSQTALPYVAFEVLKNGAAPVTAGNGGYGCRSITQYVVGANETSGWNSSITLPVSVTPGTPVTISIDWATAVQVGTASYAECNASTSPSTCFRILFIHD